ncbi:MAG: hypothetical protein OHK0022_03140 [Roseiflexaceae bacterium]
MGLSNPLCEETIVDAYRELATGEARILVADDVVQDLVNNGGCYDKVLHDAVETLKESAGDEDQAQLYVMRNCNT